MLKWVGAACVIIGCGVWGFCVAERMRRQERELRQLLQALEYLYSTLMYHQSPLPDLLSGAASAVGGTIGRVLQELKEQLLLQELSNAGQCMSAALVRRSVMQETRQVLMLLGTSLGQFDLSGQQAALEAVRAECNRRLNVLCTGLEQKVRSYRILGLCAGGALAILLL